MKPVNSSAASNPSSVLRSIGASQGMGAASKTQTPAKPAPNNVLLTDDEPDFPATIKLMVPEADPPSYDQDDILQTTIESAKQIQQLAERLKQNQSELAAKKESLNASIAAHESIAAQAQQKIENRMSQLQQHTAQVRLQQRHVMQLQTSIVKSHEATKIAIEKLVSSELTDAVTLQQMKAIQHELSEQFDNICRRWEHLHNMLENQRVQLRATTSRLDAA